ncbi:MAG: helix-turn-helix domain containing protein [Planctomycetes bacterium]|nr:helix-turn-helix domain containing protein [Planctomycetota bacterium]
MPTPLRLIDPKEDSLRRHGCLNRHPEHVGDPLFQKNEFFDPRDLLQVKYEMLRRVRDDGSSVSEAASAFGFSRPMFYQLQKAFEQAGLPGLLPEKRGPRRRHKLKEEVMTFIMDKRSEKTSGGAAALSDLVAERFNVKVHPRSVERGIAAQKKKRR